MVMEMLAKMMIMTMVMMMMINCNGDGVVEMLMMIGHLIQA